MLTRVGTLGGPARSLTAAVVVCTSSRERLPLLRTCVGSLLGASRRPDELIVVVDGDRSLVREVAVSLPSNVRVLHSDGDGLSAARNTGLAAARTDLAAFVDDDAWVDRDWLGALTAALSRDSDMVGAGGPVLPAWEADRRWMPDELLWVVGCTYTGHRVQPGPIRNPIGCNMAFRRQALLDAGSFCTTFGKRGRTLQTCEETELGLRLEQVHGPGRITYVPDAPVHHLVPAARISWRLLVRRSVSEGLAKGRLRRLYGEPTLQTERSYVRLVLVGALPRLLCDGIRERDHHRAAGAFAISCSLLTAAVAFVGGFLREDIAARTSVDERPAIVRDAG
jgi:glycosyltransferase involved in cell wall biosynthesis